MKKVVVVEILHQIYECRAEALEYFIVDQGKSEVPYTFQKFCHDMRAGELAIDMRTFRSWWDLLVAKSIVVPHGKPYGNADLRMVHFVQLLDPRVRDSLRDAHTHTHTHTNTESAYILGGKA